MSQVRLNDAFDEAHGQFAKRSGTVLRRKKYRAPNGAVLRAGVQEAYKIVNPRDYTKTPPKGAELANINLFTVSKNRATEIIRSARYSDEQLAAMTLAERSRILGLRAQLDDYTRRFYAQFKHPDPEAPLEKRPRPGSMKRRHKQYVKLDTFILALEREKIVNADSQLNVDKQ